MMAHYSPSGTGIDTPVPGRERRSSVRRRSDELAVVSNPTFGSCRATVVDLSEGGLLLAFGEQPLPPVGTQLRVEFRERAIGLRREPVQAQVVRQTRDAVGLVIL